MERLFGDGIQRMLAMVFVVLVAAQAYGEPLGVVQHIEEESVESLHGSQNVITSNDGRFVYVVSWDGDVTLFSRNADSGELTFVSALDTSLTLISSAIMTTDNYLYIAGIPVDSIDEGITAYSANVETGALTLVDSWVDETDLAGLQLPLMLDADSDGHYLYAGSVNSHSLTVLRKSANGSLSFVELLDKNDFGLDVIHVYVTEVEVSPNGNYVAVRFRLGNLNDHIALFSRDATEGTLTVADIILDGEEGIPGLDASSIDFSPDSGFLYVGSANKALYAFSIEADSTLELVDTLSEANESVPQNLLWFPSSLVHSPNGRFLYSSHSPWEAVNTYRRDLVTGELTYLGSNEHDESNGVLDNLEYSEVSPDGKHLYVTMYGSGIDGISVFDLTADIEVSASSITGLNDAESFSYTANIVNQGPATAHNISSLITLDSQVSVSSIATSDPRMICAGEGNTVSCSLAELTDGSDVSVTLQLSVQNPTQDLSFVVTAEADEIDPDTGNNSNTSTVLVTQDETEEDETEEEEANNTDDRQQDDGTTDNNSDGGGSGSFGLGFLLVAVLLNVRRMTGALRVLK